MARYNAKFFLFWKYISDEFIKFKKAFEVTISSSSIISIFTVFL